MTTFRQFCTLAGLTAAEAIRQPICLLLTTTCVVATAATPALLMHNFGEAGRLARDGGLAFHFVFGLFVAGYASCTSLSRELRTGTASVVLSKPVGRATFFLAKYAGVSVVVLAFSLCAATATLLSERVAERFVYTPTLVGYITDWATARRLFAALVAAYALAAVINYTRRRPFQSTAFGLLLVMLLLAFLVSGFFDRLGRGVSTLDFVVDWRILPASLLVSIGLLVLAAIALAVATRLDTVPTLVVTSAIFGLGLMSDYCFGAHANRAVFRVLYGLAPNWQHFWMSDALRDGASIPGVYVGNVALYAAAYAAGILCLGLASFRHVDMK